MACSTTTSTNKLQLSIWAENLVAITTTTDDTTTSDSVGTNSADLPDPFCVVTILHKEKDAWPTVVGTSEVLHKTASPDWTKMFHLEYTLGKPLHVCVSIYNNANISNSNNRGGGGGGEEPPRFLGSAVYEIGTMLGADHGGMMAKQVRGGGIVVAHVESRPAILDAGSIHFQLCGVELQCNGGGGSHTFFELQRLRTSAKTGARVWDVVYRSTPVPTNHNCNPTWSEAYLDLFALTGGCANNHAAAGRFRLAVYDYQTNGNDHVFIGDIKLTISDLVEAVDTGKGGNDSFKNNDKSLVLKSNGNETGRILVCMAIVNKSVVQQQEQQDPISRLVNQSRALNLSQGDEEEPDISVVASASDMFEADAVDMAKMMDPTFANYMAGGCEINAIIAIDATSKNGDPRQPTSLHSFGATNPYQQALQSLVSILVKYDSDQQYPVYGFGARVDGGVVNHCFPFGATPLHDGVDGVLKAYDQTFKSGLIMSSPRDFSQVIRTATIDAKERLENGHAYSVLLLFTSGAPADMSQTIAALQEADVAPLSIVIVGVSRDGETGATMSDFGSLPQLEQRCHQTTTVDGAQRPRDNVRFVSYANFKHDRETLAEAALQQIPHQLVEYFSTRQIYPNPEQDGQDEIVVQPYNEKDEVVVPIQFLQSGQVAVTGNVQPPATVSSDTTTNGTSHKTSPRISKTVEFGQQIWNKAKKNKQFGRIQRKATAEIKKQIKRKFPQARFVL